MKVHNHRFAGSLSPVAGDDAVDLATAAEEFLPRDTGAQFPPCALRRAMSAFVGSSPPTMVAI